MREVPFRRTEPDLSRIVVGAAVSSALWTEYAQLANWTLGKGAVLVPAYNPETAISAAATGVFRYRVKTRAHAEQRIWIVKCRTTGTTPVSVAVRAPASSGSTRTMTVGWGARVPDAMVYTETIASPSATEQEISIDITPTGGEIDVELIGCRDQDRAIFLVAGSEAGSVTGPHIESVGVRQPIQTGGTNAGAWGEIAALGNAGGDSRRIGIWHIGTKTSAPWTRTTNSYQDMLQFAVPVLGHKDLIADTTCTVKWNAYARVTAGAGGKIRLTRTNGGGTDEMTVTGTTLAWQTARSFTIDCDDMDSADGRQTAGTPAWDGVMPAFQGDGTNALEVVSISMWRE